MELLNTEIILFGTFFCFIFGLLLGSFANVCIYRIPLDLSIVSPPSACPKCKKFIPWHDNIPVISYIALLGKCRSCGNKISIVYPLIELLTGITFALVFYKYGMSVNTLLFLILTFSLIVISGIDYYHKVIPDIFPLILACAGLLLSFFNTTLGDTYLQRFLHSVYGLAAGGGSLFLIGVLGKAVYKKEAMGGGDVKLMAGVGAIIGWQCALFAIFVAALIGSIAGLLLVIFSKKREYLPFGPFLAFGSYITLFLPAPAVMLNMLFEWETNLISKFAGF